MPHRALLSTPDYSGVRQKFIFAGVDFRPSRPHSSSDSTATTRSSSAMRPPRPCRSRIDRRPSLAPRGLVSLAGMLPGGFRANTGAAAAATVYEAEGAQPHPGPERFVPGIRVRPTPARERGDETGIAEHIESEAPAGEAGVLQTGRDALTDAAVESIHSGERRRNARNWKSPRFGRILHLAIRRTETTYADSAPSVYSRRPAACAS